MKEESKYAKKKRLQELGIYPKFGQFDEPLNKRYHNIKESKIITRKNFSKEIPYNFKTGCIITEERKILGIGFLNDSRENRKAIRITLYGAKEIRSFLFRSGEDGLPRYSIKKTSEDDAGQVYSSDNFKNLYDAPWISIEGGKEINIIKSTIKFRKNDIEKYTGLEIKLD